MLDHLTNWKPTGPEPYGLSIDLGSNLRADLEAAQTDVFSVLLTHLAIAAGPTRECTAAELTDRAIAMADRVGGLVEPLKVYEVDAGPSKALLRSATPVERGGRLHYFELALTGLHGAQLRRYQVAKSGGPRSAVSFPITHEAIANVIAQIVG